MLPIVETLHALQDNILVDELDGVSQELVERSGLLNAPGCPHGPVLGVLHPVLVAVVDVLEGLSLLVLELSRVKCKAE